MLEREYRFYKTNQDWLRKRFSKRFLLIVGDEVVGEYESRSEALQAALRRFEMGQFLIQDTAVTAHRFRSRVSF